ncbi:6-phosphogluconolactonase [Ardenticatena maritima]|uniref:6-phosphogluconolactonase n=1 Tax=Ardenticatena maritima TaxID=872965 RepID=A0A0M9UD07_9CHLR|nr:6-phosphogluconolactonase [Ardenticatena maritima]KPL88644.1 hypothetical protein SE16_07885 [Ardenticatena maritima]GAP63498.1 6-phosphogluconolactonase [Ardenticatena maritima]
MGTQQILVADNWTTTAAQTIVRLLTDAIAARGVCSLALAGGSTPREVYRLLATPTWRDRLDWSRVHVFWGDERTVPPDHPDSNYRMAHEALLAHVPIPPENIHRMAGEQPPDVAAAAYAEELRAHFGLPFGAWPRFDLILLGMGDDGHTASLFPHTDALCDWEHLTHALFVPKLNTWRLTLTVPTINHARHVLFLVRGAPKAATVARVLEGVFAPKTFPAMLIHPRDGTLTWLLDRDAAHQLTHTQPEYVE